MSVVLYIYTQSNILYGSIIIYPSDPVFTRRNMGIGTNVMYSIHLPIIHNIHTLHRQSYGEAH